MKSCSFAVCSLLCLASVLRCTSSGEVADPSLKHGPSAATEADVDVKATLYSASQVEGTHSHRQLENLCKEACNASKRQCIGACRSKLNKQNKQGCKLICINKHYACHNQCEVTQEGKLCVGALQNNKVSCIAACRRTNYTLLKRLRCKHGCHKTNRKSVLSCIIGDSSGGDSPGGKTCLKNRSELKKAVNAYIRNSSRATRVAKKYGYPIGNWSVRRVTSMKALFKNTDFNFDINN